MEGLREILNKIYKGKEFVRKGKYGRVKGIVESVMVQQSFIFDEDTQKKLLYKVNHSVKGDKTMEKPTLEGEEFYTAYQPKFIIVSTNGVHYDFEECYLLDNEKN